MNPPFYASKAQKGNTVATYYQQTVLKLFWASLFSIKFLLCIRDIHNACLLCQVPCQSHAVETPSQMALMINSDMDTFWASQCLDHLIPVDSPDSMHLVEKRSFIAACCFELESIETYKAHVRPRRGPDS